LKGVEVDEDGFEKVAKLMNTVKKVSKLANMVLKGLKADKRSSKKVQSGKTDAQPDDVLSVVAAKKCGTSALQKIETVAHCTLLEQVKHC
jgi:hypothetical protein